MSSVRWFRSKVTSAIIDTDGGHPMDYPLNWDEVIVTPLPQPAKQLKVCANPSCQHDREDHSDLGQHGCCVEACNCEKFIEQPGERELKVGCTVECVDAKAQMLVVGQRYIVNKIEDTPSSAGGNDKQVAVQMPWGESFFSSKRFRVLPDEVGFQRRYKVEKLDGENDPYAEYFVLRVDQKGDDKIWLKCCRDAVRFLATRLQHEDHLTKLAEDLLTMHGPEMETFRVAPAAAKPKDDRTYTRCKACGLDIGLDDDMEKARQHASETHHEWECSVGPFAPTETVEKDSHGHWIHNDWKKFSPANRNASAEICKWFIEIQDQRQHLVPVSKIIAKHFPDQSASIATLEAERDGLKVANKNYHKALAWTLPFREFMDEWFNTQNKDVIEFRRLREIALHNKPDTSSLQSTNTDLAEQLEKAKGELERFRSGKFTPDEFQNLCHTFEEHPELTCQDFFDGCQHYQKSLFGKSDRDGWIVEIKILQSKLKAAEQAVRDREKAAEYFTTRVGGETVADTLRRIGRFELVKDGEWPDWLSDVAHKLELLCPAAQSGEGKTGDALATQQPPAVPQSAESETGATDHQSD